MGFSFFPAEEEQAVENMLIQAAPDRVHPQTDLSLPPW
jgi:hypothetical protein